MTIHFDESSGGAINTRQISVSIILTGVAEVLYCTVSYAHQGGPEIWILNRGEGGVSRGLKKLVRNK